MVVVQAPGSHWRRVDPLRRRVVMILHAVLVTADLPIQLVHQGVDRRIEVLTGMLDEDVLALHMESDLRFLRTPLLRPVSRPLSAFPTPAKGPTHESDHQRPSP